MFSAKKQPIYMTEDDAFARLSALCARSEHSSGQAKERMRTWGLSPDEQERVLAKLIAGRYIDDERFARMFAHDRLAFGKWGRRKIMTDLRLKGVTADVANAVLDEMDDSEFADVLITLLKAKDRTITAKSPYERRCKLMRYAVGRGFDMDMIARIIDQMPGTEAVDDLY